MVLAQSAVIRIQTVNNVTLIIVHYVLTIISSKTTLVLLVVADLLDAIFVIHHHASLVIQDIFWKTQHVILAHRDSQTQSPVMIKLL